MSAVDNKRFGRYFRLTIGSGSTAIIVEPPFRFSFSGTKSSTGILNNLNGKLYGLSRARKLLLVKEEGGPEVVQVQLEVGYKGASELIFKGTLYRGQISRQGPELINEFECKDGGIDFAQSFVNAAVQSPREAVNAVLASAPNTTEGKITELGQLLRPKIVVGNGLDVIQRMLKPGESWYIDNEQLFIVKENEVVAEFAPVISAQTGLLNTPVIDKKLVTFDTVMNPALKVSHLCSLQSTTAPYLNGLYKLLTIQYTGDSQGPDWTMKCTGMLATDYKVI